MLNTDFTHTWPCTVHLRDTSVTPQDSFPSPFSLIINLSPHRQGLLRRSSVVLGPCETVIWAQPLDWAAAGLIATTCPFSFQGPFSRASFALLSFNASSLVIYLKLLHILYNAMVIVAGFAAQVGVILCFTVVRSKQSSLRPKLPFRFDSIRLAATIQLDIYISGS